MMELQTVALGVLFNFNNYRVFRNINILILSNIMRAYMGKKNIYMHGINA